MEARIKWTPSWKDKNWLKRKWKVCVDKTVSPIASQEEKPRIRWCHCWIPPPSDQNSCQFLPNSPNKNVSGNTSCLAPWSWVYPESKSMRERRGKETAASFSDDPVAKDLPVDTGDTGSVPGSGRSPGEGSDHPLQYSCLEIPWREEPGWLQSMDSQRARPNWATKSQTL